MENTPENVIIGRKGYELRVSPITETDIEYNMFSATLGVSFSPSSLNKVYFMLRVVPIDLGFVYVGETIELNLRNYVSLPAMGMSFKWYMEKDGEHGTLPSNMKVSFSGSSIKISELRQEQEGILVCSVYTNLHFLATKKRFLLKDLAKNNDVLQSSPNHTLIFKEESPREKRDPNKLGEYRKSSIKISRQKRERNLAEEIERELSDSAAEKESYVTPSQSHDYDLEAGKPLEPEEESQTPIDYENRFPEISEDDDDDSSKAKQIDISINRGPVEDEKSDEVESVPYNHPQLTTEELFPQNEGPIDELTMPKESQYQPGEMFNYKQNNQEEDMQEYTKSKHIPKFQTHPDIYQKQKILQSPYKKTHQTANQYLDIQTKGPRPYEKDEYPNMDKIIPIDEQIASKSSKYQPKDRVIYKQNNQEIMEKSMLENKDSQLFPKFQKYHPNNHRKQNILQLPHKKTYQTMNQYPGIKKPMKDENNEYLEVVLNIDKYSRPHQVTAEDQISKLISSCSSDIECSESAVCKRSSMRNPGFCRCLPGSSGVGIFCREEIWLSDSKFDMEELHNPIRQKRNVNS